jgi:hypothetical protein
MQAGASRTRSEGISYSGQSQQASKENGLLPSSKNIAHEQCFTNKWHFISSRTIEKMGGNATLNAAQGSHNVHPDAVARKGRFLACYANQLVLFLDITVFLYLPLLHISAFKPRELCSFFIPFLLHPNNFNHKLQE